MFKELFKFFSLGTKMKVNKLISLFEKYLAAKSQEAYGSKYISSTYVAEDESGLEMNVVCNSLSIVLKQSLNQGEKSVEFLNVDINDLAMHYGKNKSFVFDMSDIQLTPRDVIDQYKSMLTSLMQENRLQMIVSMDSQKNELKVEFSSIKHIFLMRVVNEIVDFLDNCDQKNLESSKTMEKYIKQNLREDYIQVVEESANREDKMKIEISLKNSEIILPHNSHSSNFIKICIGTASFLIGQGRRVIKLPNTKKVVNNLDNFVVDRCADHKLDTITDNIIGSLKHINLYLSLVQCEELHSLGQVGEIGLNIDIPKQLKNEMWTPLAYVDIDLSDTILTTSVGHLIALIDTIQNNVDEKSEFISLSNLYWQKILFDINLNEISFSMDFQKLAK